MPSLLELGQAAGQRCAYIDASRVEFSTAPGLLQQARNVD